MIPPRKPFPSYKWRWATLTPSEGLNEPPIFLGVLRVLRENEGGLPNSAAVTEGLERVGREVSERVATRLRPARNRDRNLLRNSGQYWKALGVLESTRGITLTPFGRAVADGRTTRDEFAATVVKTLELPNIAIQPTDEIERWNRAGLQIRPLQLILDILGTLSERLGADQAYLTPDELIRIVIPLAGDRTTVMNEYVRSLSDFRRGAIALGGWPDCAPEANDRRMAREFLLFLAFYGFCKRVAVNGNYTERFLLQPIAAPEIAALIQLPVEQGNKLRTVEQVRASGTVGFIERQRVLRQVLERPQQSRFRRDVLSAYHFSCFLTGERIIETLEAAHIIPVEYQGADVVGNGICLRSDIHDLFDSGHIRISTEGALTYSDSITASPNYRLLPNRVDIPRFVNQDSIEWRWNYS